MASELFYSPSSFKSKKGFIPAKARNLGLTKLIEFKDKCDLNSFVAIKPDFLDLHAKLVFKITLIESMSR